MQHCKPKLRYGSIKTENARQSIQGEFQLVLSPEIIVEYRRVGEEFSRRRSNTEFEKLLSVLVA